MTSKKEFKLALGLAIWLVLIGVICYALPSEKPETPVRSSFKCTGGKVLFTHKTHSEASGYGLSCKDCHHHGEEDAEKMRKCGDCHFAADLKEVPAVCKECHEPDENHHAAEELEARKCNDCHFIDKEKNDELPAVCADCHDEGDVEGQEKKMDMKKRGDAFHSQCAGCHDEMGSGPGQDDCGQCHLK